MTFLHDSLNTEKFKNDRKLNLLKNNVISIGQFINLIDEHDDYTMFGPAILDKDKINEFMIEWKNHQMNIDTDVYERSKFLTVDEIVSKFDIILKYFPETNEIISKYNKLISSVSCPSCAKNRAVSDIAEIVKAVLRRGQKKSFGDDKFFIDAFIEKYSTIDDKIEETNHDSTYDVEWISPESLVGIGFDLIEKLPACCDCVIKHIGRAKILYEEAKTGYPDHFEIMLDELAAGNKNAEQFYLKYLDSCSQLDMSSAELVGNIKILDKNVATRVLELANEIRKQRILFQDDVTQIPDFDGLRIAVKKLSLSIK